MMQALSIGAEKEKHRSNAIYEAILSSRIAEKMRLQSEDPRILSSFV